MLRPLLWRLVVRGTASKAINVTSHDEIQDVCMRVSHLIRLVSYDHFHSTFGSRLALLRKPPRDGVEGFAIRHIIHLVMYRRPSESRLQVIIRLRTKYYPLCAAIVG